jgi:hypothetical protein
MQVRAECGNQRRQLTIMFCDMVRSSARSRPGSIQSSGHGGRDLLR